MRELTARRLHPLVPPMAERDAHHSPCTPGSLLEDVMTAAPWTPRDREPSGLFPLPRPTPDPPVRGPRSVGLAGSVLPSGAVQHERWAVADRLPWAADDPALRLSHDGDDVWRGSLELHPGHYEFKVVLDGSWQENYGARGMRSGPNLILDLSTSREITFCFDQRTKILTVD